MRFSIIAASMFTAMMSVAQAGQVWLTMDYVRPYKLERAVQEIIIGNPAIADVTVKDANNLLLFGKAPGATNIYMLDAEGQIIEEMIVRVQSSGTGMLTFYRGSQRTTYTCTKNCEPTVTVGDSQTSFNEVSTQVSQKYEQARAAAGAAADGN